MNEGVIVPIRKKGEENRVEEYRGVLITQSVYKVYASVLAKRLRRKVDEKLLLPPSQMGFRRGLGTIDNVYVLNYLINKYIYGKKENMVVVFVYLKATFDLVDRRVLSREMRRRGVRGCLVKRCVG